MLSSFNVYEFSNKMVSYITDRKLIILNSVSMSYLDLYTVCPRRRDPFYTVTYYYKLGNYFLDTQYTVAST